MTIVLQFDRRVDPGLGRETMHLPVRRRGDRPSTPSAAPRNRPDRESRTSPRRSGRGFPTVAGKLQGQNAHADQVAAVDALEARGQHGPDAQEESALGGPVAAAARAVFRPGEDHQRHALGLVLHRRVVDGHRLAVGQMAGDAAFRARGQKVAEADVGEACRGSSRGRCPAATRSC